MGANRNVKYTLYENHPANHNVKYFLYPHARCSRLDGLKHRHPPERDVMSSRACRHCIPSVIRTGIARLRFSFARFYLCPPASVLKDVAACPRCLHCPLVCAKQADVRTFHCYRILGCLVSACLPCRLCGYTKTRESETDVYLSLAIKVNESDVSCHWFIPSNPTQPTDLCAFGKMRGERGALVVCLGGEGER